MGKTETNPDPQLAGRHRIESTLRAMHDIQTSSHEIGFDSQVRSILAIGIRQLGLRVGLVSKLNRDQIGMPYVVGGGDSLPEGTVVRACDSFCGEARSLRVDLSADPGRDRARVGPHRIQSGVGRNRERNR